MNVMKRSNIVVLLATAGFMAHADQVVTTQTVADSQPIVVEVPANQPVDATSQRRIVIKQPATVVEASPLSDSRADQLRRQRQEVEMQTEQKIVEKLETSRMEDEKARIDRIFGNKQEEQKPVVVAAPVQVQVAPAPAPVQVAPPAPAQLPAQPATPAQIDDVKKEIIQAIQDGKEKDEGADGKSLLGFAAFKNRQSKTYFSGGLGSGGYSSASNVEGKGSAGFALGVAMPNHVAIEGTFLFSDFYIDQLYWYSPGAIFKEMYQYNIGASIKYSFFEGAFRPFVGGQMMYTYRRYFDRFYYGPGYMGSMPGESEAISHAVDVGLNTGLNIFVSDNFAVGVEYKYNTNMIHRSGSDIILNRMYYRPGNARPVEEVDYWTATINGIYLF